MIIVPERVLHKNFMINTFYYKGKEYPSFQKEGNAAQFAIPYAKHLCKGEGLDVGCGAMNWRFPGSWPVDPAINKYDALNFPDYSEKWDYIFSSHCLEHLDNPYEALDYWTYKLREHGVLFLYLPDFSQEYWRPWNNTKHVHVLTPEIIRGYMEDKQYDNIFISGVDLNNSFMATGHKTLK